MKYEVSVEPWENGLDDPMYIIGITKEWEQGGLSDRKTVENRLPAKWPEFRYATRCIGNVDIGKYKCAVMRHFWTWGLRTGMQRGNPKHYEYFTLEAIIDNSTGESAPEVTPGSKMNKLIHIEKTQEGILFLMDEGTDPDMRGVDYEEVLKDIEPTLRKEILEGEPMFEFAEKE